jgi:hypothetical protein
MARVLRISPFQEWWAADLEGKLIGDDSYDWLIGNEPADVYNAPQSDLWLRYLPEAVPEWPCNLARPHLVTAAKLTDSRGPAASGSWYQGGRLRARKVRSGIMGYYDLPHRRVTEFTRDYPAEWLDVLPLILAGNDVFRHNLRGCGHRYNTMIRARNNTDPQFMIQDTVFTTATANRDYTSTVHRDRGNLKTGMSVMCVVKEEESAGKWAGGELVFPRFRVAVDMRDRDVLLFPPDEWHGNVQVRGEGRLSLVCYFRSGMMREGG